MDYKTLKVLDNLAEAVKEITAPKSEFAGRVKELISLTELAQVEKDTAQLSIKELEGIKLEVEQAQLEARGREARAVSLEEDANVLIREATKLQESVGEKAAASELRHIETVKAQREFKLYEAAISKDLQSKEDKLSKQKNKLDLLEEKLLANAKAMREALG